MELQKEELELEKEELELEKEEFLIYDRSYLEILIDDYEDKIYFSAEDLSIILGFDVLNVIKKEYQFLYKNEIFINQDGFNSIYPQFPNYFQYWYYTNIFKPM